MILESIVTTVDIHGEINIAPMGPEVSSSITVVNPCSQTICLRPFHSSLTHKNLLETRRAVVHVTDDVELFARAAVNGLGGSEAMSSLVNPIQNGRFFVLRDCHRWFAVEVESIESGDIRSELNCRIVDSQVVRPFYGFNRAKFAVIEAAILATRTHLIPQEEIEFDLRRLATLVEKTGGEDEKRAFEYLNSVISRGFHSL